MYGTQQGSQPAYSSAAPNQVPPQTPYNYPSTGSESQYNYSNQPSSAPQQQSYGQTPSYDYPSNSYPPPQQQSTYPPQTSVPQASVAPVQSSQGSYNYQQPQNPPAITTNSYGSPSQPEYQNPQSTQPNYDPQAANPQYQPTYDQQSYGQYSQQVAPTYNPQPQQLPQSQPAQQHQQAGGYQPQVQAQTQAPAYAQQQATYAEQSYSQTNYVQQPPQQSQYVAPQSPYSAPQTVVQPQPQAQPQSQQYTQSQYPQYNQTPPSQVPAQPPSSWSQQQAHQPVQHQQTADYSPQAQPQSQKRGYDNAFEQPQGALDPAAGPPKTIRTEDVPEGHVAVHVLIPSDQVGLAIGKSGAIMKQIVQQIGCKFALQEHHECPQGGIERILSLAGELEQVEAAQRLIMEALQNKRGKDQEVLKWLIQAEQVGLVIGRQGSTIKMIKDSTGANVKIAHEQEMPPGSVERLIYLTGTPSQVDMARAHLVSKVGGRPADPEKPREGEYVIVPSRSVGYLLGPKAQELKRICEIAGGGLKIMLALDNECTTGDGTRKARFVGGSPESVGIAKQLLLERVELWRSEQRGSALVEDEVCLKIAVPAPLLGHLIGRGGGFVKQINSSPNIMMKVLQEEPSRSLVQDLKPVVFNGPISNVFQAQRTMLDHLKSAPDSLKEQAAQRIVLPHPNIPPAMGPGHGGPMPGHGHGGPHPGRGQGGPPPFGQQPSPYGPGGYPPYGQPPAYPQPYGYGHPPPYTGTVNPHGPIQIFEPLRHCPHILGMGVVAGGLEISVTAQIISKIVGQGGSTIRNLSQMTGCNIQAQKRETVTPGQMDRKIIIKGNAQQIDALQHQLLDILNN